MIENINVGIIKDGVIKAGNVCIADVAGREVRVCYVSWPTPKNDHGKDSNYSVPSWAARHRQGPADFLAFQLGRCETAVKVIPVKEVSRMTVSFNADYGLLPVSSVFGWTDTPVPLEKLPPGPVQRKLL